MRGCRTILPFLSRDCQPLQPIRQSSSGRVLEKLPQKSQSPSDVKECPVSPISTSKMVTQKVQTLKGDNSRMSIVFAYKIQGLFKRSLRRCRLNISNDDNENSEETELDALDTESFQELSLVGLDRRSLLKTSFRQPSDITMSDFNDSQVLSCQWDGTDLEDEDKCIQEYADLISCNSHKKQQTPVESHSPSPLSPSNGGSSRRLCRLSKFFSMPAISPGKTSLNDKPMQPPRRRLSQTILSSNNHAADQILPPLYQRKDIKKIVEEGCLSNNATTPRISNRKACVDNRDMPLYRPERRISATC